MKYYDNELLGVTPVEVENKDNEELIFTDEKGIKYIFYHYQDCCESVLIEDICGDLEDLVGNPLLVAEEVSSAGKGGQSSLESETWTFYKFSTIKGSVTVRWYGTSNGYYSESVHFRISKEN